ncbi:MAG: hypothetical protein QOF30_457 [Acidimicrobiaceae bacterium]|nr:hypothetical protein [Acidimicrobiaceae bacterium]
MARCIRSHSLPLAIDRRQPLTLPGRRNSFCAMPITAAPSEHASYPMVSPGIIPSSLAMSTVDEGSFGNFGLTTHNDPLGLL